MAFPSAFFYVVGNRCCGPGLVEESGLGMGGLGLASKLQESEGRATTWRGTVAGPTCVQGTGRGSQEGVPEAAELGGWRGHRRTFLKGTASSKK